MTVDLNSMIDLRDIQVALDVARRAEMGWFDVEFTMYGCSYLYNGKRYYRVSAEAEKIYDFIENGAQKNILPTNIAILTEKYPVPIGMHDYVARDVKQSLARQMRDDFSGEFFKYLAETAELITEDTAVPILLQERDKVEGCFNHRKIKKFEDLVNFAYNCRKITLEHYKEFTTWIAEERKSMEDDLLIKDTIEKTFYAIAYKNDFGLEYWENACKEHVYKKKYELEQKGVLVSPIFSETYWYNYTTRLSKVREVFEKELRSVVNTDYMEMIEMICGNNKRMTKKEFAQRVEYVKDNFGENAKDTFLQYGRRWGCVNVV